MPDFNAQSPKGSRFGWSKPARIEEFEKLKSNASFHHAMMFKGEKQQFPVIRVCIDLPKYRLENGRTASAQEEYLAKNPSIQKDLFEIDPELWTAQEAQHKLLLDMANFSDLQQTFEDSKNIQIEVIILDEYGFIINGNRRVATWRDLVFKDKNKYGHFQNIDVIVLPHCDAKEIDRIEARLQITKDIRANYSWDARAKMMQAKQKRDGFSNKELADLYSMNETEIKVIFDMLSYAEEYLKSRSKVGHWSFISERESAFEKIAWHRPKIATIGKQELFKELSFVLIDKPDEAGGRLYDQIPAIYDHLETVATKLLVKFPVTEESTAGDGLEDMFGGQALPSAETSTDIPLAKEIAKPENSDSARSLLVDVLETQKQLKKDSKGANFLLTCCSKAQASLTAGVADLKAETKTQGVEKQLDSIDDLVNKIRAFILKNA